MYIPPAYPTLLFCVLAGGAVLSEGYQMMVNDSVEQSKAVADKYIELCKTKTVSMKSHIIMII